MRTVRSPGCPESPVWHRLLLVAIVAALVSAPPARAARGVTPEEQEKINRALARGVDALKQLQEPDGTWARSGEYHKLGYAALPGLTLLECGVPAGDPVISRAAQAVRLLAPKVNDTYDLSLALLFLDRLRDGRDKELIQTLATRLIAGQTVTGGWGYRCPRLTKKEKKEIIQALAKLDPSPNAQKPGESRPRVQDVVPAKWRTLPVFLEGKQSLVDPLGKGRAPLGATTDNSNTQFAMLALWAAGRHQISIKRSRDLIAQRFRTSQNRDGTRRP
jgi:hypothetical protein